MRGRILARQPPLPRSSHCRVQQSPRRFSRVLRTVVANRHQNGRYSSNIELLHVAHEANLRKQRKVIRSAAPVLIRNDAENDLEIERVEGRQKYRGVVSVQFSYHQRLYLFVRDRF